MNTDTEVTKSPVEKTAKEIVEGMPVSLLIPVGMETVEHQVLYLQHLKMCGPLHRKDQFDNCKLPEYYTKGNWNAMSPVFDYLRKNYPEILN